MSDVAIRVDGLVRRFGLKTAVDGITFDVPTGSICGLIGPNGAGKTTTIRILLDLLRADRGSVHVLGMDSTRDAFHIASRVGYVPERHHIFEWMSVRQVLDFASGVYPRWDWEECNHVGAILDLPSDRKVKDLSRGETAKLALLIALGHKPELLILDEPTSGLDPLVRRDFLAAIVGLLKDANRTVFFSTHILSDVERVADRVVVMDEGRVVANDSLDSLRRRFLKVSVLFRSPPAYDFEIIGARRVDKGVREWVAVFDEGGRHNLARLAADPAVADVSTQPMTLEDAFVELVRKERTEG
ncbi:MAG TPA: ABC transporter ATP-binding protein [Planctomycetaceae bacterium]|nr:ABC transporter ATP-binding protein [Planctomycetaceae bacterium]